MSLDPAVRDFLSTKPDAGDPAAPADRRREVILAESDKLFARFGEAAPAGAERDEVIARDGAREVRLRVYRPTGATGP